MYGLILAFLETRAVLKKLFIYSIVQESYHYFRYICTPEMREFDFSLRASYSQEESVGQKSYINCQNLKKNFVLISQLNMQIY